MQTGNKLILPEIEKLLASTYTTFMTIEEKSKLIIKEIKSQTGTDPCVMFRNMVKNEYINMHGPEHHVLDGACLLMAFYQLMEPGEITCNIQPLQLVNLEKLTDLAVAKEML